MRMQIEAIMQQSGKSLANAVAKNVFFYSVISLMTGVLVYAMSVLPIRG